MMRSVAMKPRLLYFVTEDWYFCSHRLPLAKAALEAGYAVSVVTRVRRHGDAIRRAGLRLIPFEISRQAANPFTEARVIARLAALYRRIRPDVVHHVAIKPVLYGALAARLAGVEHVISALAGMGWLFTASSKKADLLMPVVSLGLSRMLSRGRIIVQNPDDADLIRKLGIRREKIALIRGSGVDLGVFRPQPEPPGIPLVLLHSRMLRDKGVGEFVKAARLLHQRGKTVRFVLGGNPDPANPASIPKDQLEAWHRSGEVEWWGERADIPEVLRQAHVVCLPSYREGLPKSLLEAAASGRPIVTTDVPGCREIVADGVNGFLVPARQAEALADAIERLLADAALRRRMGWRGRQRVENEFSLDRVIADTMDLYQRVLA
jgi:glycosyltransferase involved in cell wall biosynthesis